MECNESGAELQAVCKRDQTGVETKQLLYEHWTLNKQRDFKYAKQKRQQIHKTQMKQNL